MKKHSGIKQIIDSYSQDNFSIKALTQADINEMKNNWSNEKVEMEFQEEDFEFDADPIHIYQEVISETLVDGFIVLELTVDWKSPDDFENRSFDWHSMGRSNAPNVYGHLTNNRCCWAIYYSYYFINSGGVRQRMINNSKLKGGNQATAIGLQQVTDDGVPHAVEVEVKYRKEKHYSFYYFK